MLNNQRVISWGRKSLGIGKIIVSLSAKGKLHEIAPAWLPLGNIDAHSSESRPH
jgi:hypothetical protein